MSSLTITPTALFAENWNPETLIIFLRGQNLNLDEDDYKILRKEKIDSQIFPDMTERKFMEDGMKRGPAMKLDKQARMFKKQTKVLEKGKIKYFWLFLHDMWSIQHFISWSTNMFGRIDKNEAHTVFYNTLYIICDDPSTSQEVLKAIRNLLFIKKVNGTMARKPLADISNQQKVSLPSSPISGKKRSIGNIMDISANVPLRKNGFIDILEVLKVVVREFDQGTIALGSIRSYKISNHIYVDFEHHNKVLRESTYDAEMYRILTNWLRKIHGYEITGQWHLEQVCDDGNYHHYYCDLTIKNLDNPHPEALIELLVTASVSKLNSHFDQVFKYAERLCPQEVWIVHFSREDFVVTNHTGHLKSFRIG
ncbi:24461_t:CDS:2, partial [Cetraspora pellucida]